MAYYTERHLSLIHIYRLFPFAFFALAVVNEGLHGGDQEDHAEAQPDNKKSQKKDRLNCCHRVLPPLS